MSTFVVARTMPSGERQFFMGIDRGTIVCGPMIFEAMRIGTRAEADLCLKMMGESGLHGFAASEILAEGSSETDCAGMMG